MDAYEINPFQHELNPSEKIYWQSQPQQGLIFRPADIIMIPFSFAWSFWTVPIGFQSIFYFHFFELFSTLPLLLVAFYITIGRFFLDMKRRSQTHYAITNERALIKTGILSQRIHSINYRMLPEINITTYKEGVGTITFGPQSPFPGLYEGLGIPLIGVPLRGYYYNSSAFERIENAENVYAYIRRLQQME